MRDVDIVMIVCVEDVLDVSSPCPPPILVVVPVTLFAIHAPCHDDASVADCPLALVLFFGAPPALARGLCPELSCLVDSAGVQGLAHQVHSRRAGDICRGLRVAGRWVR